MIIKQRAFMPLIVGADLNAYNIARSFHEQYQVMSIVVSKALLGPTSNSKIIENIIEEKLEDDKVLVERLIKIRNENQDKKLILFACSDWYLKQILENREQLEQHFIIPYIDIGLMNEIVMKDSFYNLCENLEINYPKTFIYDCKEENKFDFNFGYPIIAKPADSASYHYAEFKGKQKAYKFYNEEELHNMLNKLGNSSYDGKFIIQDFIPGDDSNMYVLTCYCDKNSKVKMYALGHVLLEEHTPGAIGNHAAIINEINEVLFEKAKRFLEHVKYVGYAHFDIKYDERDKNYKFFEINTRLGRNNYYITASGVNIAKMIVDEYIYEKELEEVIAEDEYLTTIIPKILLKKYLTNNKLRAKVRELIKKQKVCNPLMYDGDNNIKRVIYIHVNLLNQIRKYAKYYKKTDEKVKKKELNI